MRPPLAASTFLRLVSIIFNSRRLYSSPIGFTTTLRAPSALGFELTVSVTTSFAVFVSSSSGVCGARNSRPLIASR
jgi:hypothetical protein